MSTFSELCKAFKDPSLVAHRPTPEELKAIQQEAVKEARDSRYDRGPEPERSYGFGDGLSWDGR